MSGFLIGDRHVGDGAPCLIVAEVAQAHEGSVRIAHDFVDAIAKAGADAVKFQCHLGDDTNEFRVPPRWGADVDRQAYWHRTGFAFDEWHSLMAHATAKGLIFLCSPFSVEAVQMLDPLVPAWKVPSGEITNEPLRSAIEATGKPIIQSCGMSTYSEIHSATYRWHRKRYPFALLQCTSEYPARPEHIGVGLVSAFHGNWQTVTGLSDHSGTIWPSLAAVTLGASIVEVHVKLSEHDSGFDASSSITIEELARLVEGVRFIEKAMKPVDKDRLAEELAPMRRVFMGQRAAAPWWPPKPTAEDWMTFP